MLNCDIWVHNYSGKKLTFLEEMGTDIRLNEKQTVKLIKENSKDLQNAERIYVGKQGYWRPSGEAIVFFSLDDVVTDNGINVELIEKIRKIGWKYINGLECNFPKIYALTDRSLSNSEIRDLTYTFQHHGFPDNILTVQSNNPSNQLVKLFEDMNWQNQSPKKIFAPIIPRTNP